MKCGHDLGWAGEKRSNSWRGARHSSYDTDKRKTRRFLQMGAQPDGQGSVKRWWLPARGWLPPGQQAFCAHWNNFCLDFTRSREPVPTWCFSNTHQRKEFTGLWLITPQGNILLITTAAVWIEPSVKKPLPVLQWVWPKQSPHGDLSTWSCNSDGWGGRRRFNSNLIQKSPLHVTGSCWILSPRCQFFHNADVKSMNLFQILEGARRKPRTQFICESLCEITHRCGEEHANWSWKKSSEWNRESPEKEGTNKQLACQRVSSLLTLASKIMSASLLTSSLPFPCHPPVLKKWCPSMHSRVLAATIWAN